MRVGIGAGVGVGACGNRAVIDCTYSRSVGISGRRTMTIKEMIGSATPDEGSRIHEAESLNSLPRGGTGGIVRA